MNSLFLIAVIFIFIVAIAALVYLIKSLVDMWREYAATKNETVLLLFILNIVGFFLSGSLISMIVAIIFYWNRSKKMRNLGIILLIAGPILFILLIIGSFTLYDAPMMDWEQMEYEMNL
ncbi:MAG: hypothetical protein LPJ96_13100 [Exiguobacterium sp.]|uniref:Uncharacterized protein n=1 Tax=Exiguobacterium alkaliphilum TaxID=1428684 RepID=A0ABT2KYR1_9BACL|nr:hypothetical protein [Exiguobacterium alkaliphilum]MDX5324544.1 hypothetical protein [Exiguobacterium sp.]MCT4796072.1 hypothetical protein [Exiguobacterium alkaliphilum]MDX5426388.1 hypothetical protein [Exiguobacterium sp.]MDX6773761.1 hypothetical protein [Exiguobacterium sp.]QUE87460.1 hypothetical protein KB235_06135 [Exiguobacterium alkaliphilum]